MTSLSHILHKSSSCQPLGSDKSMTTPPSSPMLDSASGVTLPPFRTISRIAARGRDDPNGELWRRSLGRDPLPPFGVPRTDFRRSLLPPSFGPPAAQRYWHRRASSEGHSPQRSVPEGSLVTWAGRGQVRLDIDHDQNSDAYAGSETSSSGSSDDASVSADSPSVESGWESLVTKKRDEGNYIVYECRWTGDDNQSCGYTAKRQLVKRHVEDKHLRIKRYECTFCGRRFAQKSSCSTHENSHTGAKPHPCFFHCGKWFSDPSKRTRHAYKAHAMKPKPRAADNP